MTSDKTGQFGPDMRRSVQPTLWRDIGAFAAALKKAPSRKRVIVLVAGILAVLGCNIYAQIQLNRWNGLFFDALSSKNFDAFLRYTGLFFMLIAALLTLVVVQTLLQELLKLELRRLLTVHIADLWLQRARPYRLGFAGEIGANPDQRVQEDTRKLAEFTAELVIGLCQQMFMLTTFIGVLWSLSSAIQFSIGGSPVAIPGYMVWAALLYAGIGSSVAFLVGRPLIRLNADRSQKEAELRFALVRLTENAESIGFLRGERDERDALNKPIGAVIDVLREIAFKLARLTWVVSGYGWLSMIVPVLVACPGYFSGAVTFGGLMRLVDAFGQVQASLRWLVDNVAKIADWRAALHRVMRFEEELRLASEEDRQLDGIRIETGADASLAFDNLCIRLPDGTPVVASATLKLAPGERVRLVSSAGSGKSTLLRAIAGLWPWGAGTIQVPAANDMMFLPARPYLPLGTLRDAVCYPGVTTDFSDATVQAAMTRCGLGSWIDHLDRNARWDRDLTTGEQQRLTFARAVLHRPGLIIMDEATAAMDPHNQDSMLRLFEDELKGATLLFISHRGGYEVLAARVVELLPGEGGSRLIDLP